MWWCREDGCEFRELPLSTAYLDQILPVSSTVEAVEVTRRASTWSWFAKKLPTDVA